MPEKNERKSKYIKRAAAVAAMLICVLISVQLLQYFFCIPNSVDENRVLTLHKEPENSIDVLLIGSSATYSGFASAYAYEKYGFTSYPYAIGGATCTMWKPALQDTLRTQKPKLVVVDVFGGGYETELIRTRCNQVYTIMTHYPLSAEKVSMAKEIVRDIDRTSVASLLFPILRYHTNIAPNIRKIKPRLRAEFYGPSPLKGIETRARDRKLANVDPASFTDEPAALDSTAERSIRDFIDYCRSRDIQVLFVKFPTVLTENDADEMLVNLRANRILEIAKESGYPTLNMQPLFHELGLKEKNDYYNHGHTNVRGQKKVTDYLGGYIRDEMGVGPTKLSKENKAAWDESVRYHHAFEDMIEEMIRNGEDVDIGDSPETVDRVEKYMKEHDL